MRTARFMRLNESTASPLVPSRRDEPAGFLAHITSMKIDQRLHRPSPCPESALPLWRRHHGFKAFALSDQAAQLVQACPHARFPAGQQRGAEGGGFAVGGRHYRDAE